MFPKSENNSMGFHAYFDTKIKRSRFRPCRIGPGSASVHATTRLSFAEKLPFRTKKRRDHYIREARRILVKTSNKTFISVVSQPPSTQQRALALAKVFISVQKNAESTSFGKRFAFWLKQNHYLNRRSCSVRAAVR